MGRNNRSSLIGLPKPANRTKDLLVQANKSPKRFACSQVWLVETYLEKDGKEQQIQSYRFTKTG